MKLTKEHKVAILSNIDKNIDKRVSKTNIIGIEEVDSPAFIGVKLMAKKTENPPKYFTDFADEVRTFIKMQLEFNKKQMEFNEWVKTEITEIKQDVVAIKACPTIKRELGH